MVSSILSGVRTYVRVLRAAGKIGKASRLKSLGEIEGTDRALEATRKTAAPRSVFRPRTFTAHFASAGKPTSSDASSMAETVSSRHAEMRKGQQGLPHCPLARIDCPYRYGIVTLSKVEVLRVPATWLVTARPT